MMDNAHFPFSFFPPIFSPHNLELFCSKFNEKVDLWLSFVCQFGN